MIDPKTSSKVGAFSFAAAVAIAFFHAPAWLCKQENGLRLYVFLGEIFVPTALAFFFTVSGFFLAQHSGENQWWRMAVKQRVRTLVIPFLIWNAVFMLAIYGMLWFLGDNNKEFGRLMPGGVERWLTFDVLSFVRSAPNPILWFLRTLFLLCVISPVLLLAVRIRFFPLFLFIAFFSMEALRLDFPCAGLVQMRSLVYFVLGLSLGRRNQLPELETRHTALVLSLGGVLVTVAFVSHMSWMRCIGTFFLLIGFWGSMPALASGRALQKYAFPLYMTHYVFIWLMIFLNQMSDFARTGSLLWACVVGGGAVFGSWFSIRLLRMLPHRVCTVVFGGR